MKIIKRGCRIGAMIFLLFGVFWLTISGANYPSELLHKILFSIQDILLEFLKNVNCPEWIYEPLIMGVYQVTAWVVSVMLPPIFIFFSLFTILDDLNYLPRIAFNLEPCFRCCGACGKQGLTMLQGIGCNAVGVTGCRVIDSKRERLIAILTNCFMPCNGRFPLILIILNMFFLQQMGQGIRGSIYAAVLMTGLLLLAVGMTFLVSWILSKTLLKGSGSQVKLEAAEYRNPTLSRVKPIVHSIVERTWDVLKRALIVSAPAGLIIWLSANVSIGSQSILAHVAGVLDPIGALLGMDGIIITAFILGFPANEIVLPIILMGYLCTGTLIQTDDVTQIYQLLINNGWTIATAVCVLLFTVFHWPCSTTCLTIRKETGSMAMMFLGMLIPTVLGAILCSLAASIL